MTTQFDLTRFVEAQDAHGTYDAALTELRGCRKTTHWMWFVFPQLAGLGHSPTAQFYALSGLAEARAYAAHPVLGPRLVAAATTAAECRSADATVVFGSIDALKLRSSMTLFARAVPEEPAFAAVLEHYFSGVPDQVTLKLLDADQASG